MKKDNEITLEEAALAYIPAHNLSKEEKEEADKMLLIERIKLLQSMRPEEKLYFDLVGLRIRMEDFLTTVDAIKNIGFGSFLKEYLHILNKKHRDFAKEISLHYTKLSRLLNSREQPNIAILYRLEKHSGDTIPAILWWKVMNKELEAEIKGDDYLRKVEAEKVSNALLFE